MNDELDLKYLDDEFRQMIAKHGKKFVTWTMFAEALNFAKAMNLKNVERNARLDALEQRCKALEQTSMKYCDIWQPGRVYEKNSVVTLKGSWWLAPEATSARPGDPDEASRSWVLTVKKGTTA